MAQLKTLSISWDDEDRPVITIDYAGDEVAPASANPDEWLAVLGERLGDKPAMFLSKLITLNEAQGFASLAELATELGVPKKEVDGWNRNFGRSIKSVVRELGFLRPELEDGTAQVFDFEWDNDKNEWRYAVPTKFRGVLAKALED